MAAHVFLSYASPDRAIAETVCAALEAGGIPCWMAPRNILPGSDYGASIIEALEAAQAMVLIFSSHSNVSPHIKREIERAVNKGIAVIPFRIENVLPSKSLEYFISTQHWLDAFTPPLERHLQHLVDTMRVLLSPTAARQPVGAEPLPPPKTPAAAPVAAAPRGPAVGGLRLKGGVLWAVVVILAGAVVAGLIIIRKSRPGRVTGPETPPAKVTVEKKPPEYPAALKYSLERAKTAPNAAEKLFWLNKALEQEPNLAEALNDRGIVQAQGGQEDQALQDFSRAISLAPGYYKAYNNRGNLHQKRGDLDQALADYNKALALNAHYVPAFVNRGNLYRKKGLTEQALADYNQAIALKPEDGEAYYNRGLLFEARQEYDRALADFQKAIALQPQSAAAYHGRGYLFLNRGDYDAALADLNQAITLKADLAAAYRHRGQVYLKKGDTAKAQSDFQTARTLEAQAAGKP